MLILVEAISDSKKGFDVPLELPKIALAFSRPFPRSGQPRLFPALSNSPPLDLVPFCLLVILHLTPIQFTVALGGIRRQWLQVFPSRNGRRRTLCNQIATDEKDNKNGTKMDSHHSL